MCAGCQELAIILSWRPAVQAHGAPASSIWMKRIIIILWDRSVRARKVYYFLDSTPF
jgi:hypothetical protein